MRPETAVITSIRQRTMRITQAAEAMVALAVMVVRLSRHLYMAASRARRRVIRVLVTVGAIAGLVSCASSPRSMPRASVHEVRAAPAHPIDWESLTTSGIRAFTHCARCTVDVEPAIILTFGEPMHRTHASATDGVNGVRHFFLAHAPEQGRVYEIECSDIASHATCGLYDSKLDRSQTFESIAASGTPPDWMANAVHESPHGFDSEELRDEYVLCRNWQNKFSKMDPHCPLESAP